MLEIDIISSMFLSFGDPESLNQAFIQNKLFDW